MRPQVSQSLQGSNCSHVKGCSSGAFPCLCFHRVARIGVSCIDQSEGEAASYVEISKEKPRTGFTTFGPLSQIRHTVEGVGI